jgi:hypothetical protein
MIPPSRPLGICSNETPVSHQSVARLAKHHREEKLLLPVLLIVLFTFALAYMYVQM